LSATDGFVSLSQWKCR